MIGPFRPFGELDGVAGPTRPFDEFGWCDRFNPTRPFGELEGMIGPTRPFGELDCLSDSEIHFS